MNDKAFLVKLDPPLSEYVRVDGSEKVVIIDERVDEYVRALRRDPRDINRRIAPHHVIYEEGNSTIHARVNADNVQFAHDEDGARQTHEPLRFDPSLKVRLQDTVVGCRILISDQKHSMHYVPGIVITDGINVLTDRGVLSADLIGVYVDGGPKPVHRGELQITPSGHGFTRAADGTLTRHGRVSSAPHRLGDMTPTANAQTTILVTDKRGQASWVKVAIV